MHNKLQSRRSLLQSALSAGALLPWMGTTHAAFVPKVKPKYMLASCMYGYTPLTEILPEVSKIGATAIDLWPKVHGNQREQLDEIGVEPFAELLQQHNVTLGCITQYKLGPHGLQEEMQLAKRLRCTTIVTGAVGPKGLKGSELKQGVKKFFESMRPHLEIAGKCDLTIAIENHANNLVFEPDSMKWLAEFSEGHPLAIALAPYHLPQEEVLIAQLIRELGPKLHLFYAWQHGKGSMQAQPKEDELLQMPGRGPLNFAPLIDALGEINFEGWIEIFMHPFPRGIAIHPTVSAVTEEINRSREYLAKCGLG